MVPEITKKIMREKRDAGILSSLEEIPKKKKKKSESVTRGESAI